MLNNATNVESQDAITRSLKLSNLKFIEPAYPTSNAKTRILCFLTFFKKNGKNILTKNSYALVMEAKVYSMTNFKLSAIKGF